MGQEVAGEFDRAQVRLAELVAALSLGIDLGFGQPMEHVLRQCLIALRLAEGIGLGEEQRAVVYYTALLVNVGCHSDAHEQAKWFGDDIALKSIKYDHEPRSLRMAATGIRFLGAAYERWDGRGWPGELEGEEVPLASRLAHVAEFIEVANRMGGAELAAEAGTRLGLGEADVRLIRRAGLVHGLGRLGVSNAILDKRGPLGAGEWERVRLQPYLTDRMLRQSETLAPVARIAVQHRERLDRSGYPRGLWGAGISREARILAAADAYQAMREPRPHRRERSAEDAAAELRGDVKAGRHDADAVEAVLGAAGHRVPRRREGPAGLTPREVDVLRLLARGLSNKEIAERLVISPKTVANHAEHIYAKIDASSRAAAGLFAMQQGLLPEEEFPAGVSA